MNYCFCILKHTKNYLTLNIFEKCYNSIRKFYPDSLIVIIDDKSTIPINSLFKNVIYVTNSIDSTGELLPYYYFYKYKWADKMIILQDSMELISPIEPKVFERDVNYLWYFDNHSWDDKKDIDNMLKNLNFSTELIEKNYQTSWLGCFGSCMLISHTTLVDIVDKYNLFSILPMLKTRQQRCSLERVIGIIFDKEGHIDIKNPSLCGNILQHPYFYGNWHIIPGVREQIISNYNSPIIKNWLQR